MAIQHFGNAFKAEIKNNNRKNDLKRAVFNPGVSDEIFFAPGNTDGYNYEDGHSEIINNFWDFFRNELRGGVGGPGVNGDDWRTNTDLAHAAAGKKLGQLYNNFWEINARELHQNGNNIAVWDLVKNERVESVRGILRLGSKLSLWGNGWDKARVPNSSGVINPRLPLTVAASTAGTYSDLSRVEKWLVMRNDFIQAPANAADKAAILRELSFDNMRQLDLEGWNPEDFQWGDDIAGTGRSLRLVSLDNTTALNNSIENYANIHAAKGKFNLWRNSFSGATPVAIRPYNPDNGELGDLQVTGVQGSRDVDVALEIIDKWLERRTELNIRPANLTVQNIRVLFSRSWNPEDISVNPVRHPVALNPADSTDAYVGFADIAAQNKIVVWRNGMNGAAAIAGGAGTSGRTELRSANDNDLKIMDHWLAQLTKFGVRTTELSIGQVQRLHIQGWDPEDIRGKDTAGQPKFYSPMGNELIGFNQANVDKKVMVDYAAAFRSVAGHSSNAKSLEIKVYFDKAQAAAAAAAEFNQKVQNNFVTERTNILNALKASLENDEDGKPNLNESTVTAKLKELNTSPAITEATWEAYVNASTRTDLFDRKTKVENAIKECRKTQKGVSLETQKNNHIATLNGLMTDKKDGKPDLDTTTVTAKLKELNTSPAITEATWEAYIKNAPKNDLGDRKTKVETAISKCREVQQPEPGKKPLSHTVIKEAFTEAGFTVKPNTSAMGTWRINESNKELGDKAKLAAFLKDFFADKPKFVANLKKAAPTENLEGNTDEERVNNLLEKQTFTKVLENGVKARLEDTTFQTAIQAEMKKDKNGDEPLDVKQYEMSGDKYTKKAMTKYLINKYNGAKQAHAKSDIPQKQGGPTNEKPWWQRYGCMAIWLPILLITIGVVVFYWTNIMNWWNGAAEEGADESEEK